MPMLLADCPSCGSPIYDIEGQTKCPKCGTDIPEWFKDVIPERALPATFGKVPDVRHPDTVLLDWLERRWAADDDGCPIGFDGESFVPLCESGVWPADMSLRQAIQKAMKIEQDRGDE